MFKKFTFYKQLNAMDCGPACLKMVAQFYGKHFNLETIKDLSGQSKGGVSLLGLSEAAEKMGFRTRGAHVTYEELSKNAILPSILHWNQNHYAVAIAFNGNGSVKIADPAKGIITISKKEFLEHFITTQYVADDQPVGSALLLDPSDKFFHQESEKSPGLTWKWLLNYIKKSSLELVQVFILLLTTSTLQLIFPFLTQSIVDTGINGKNVHFITVVLLAQLMLVASTNIGEFIRSRLLLQVSSILNLSILSDFWIKLTHLPISYFTRGHVGDTMQRIGDHRKIQEFLTSSALNTFFSAFNFIIYAFILAAYNSNIFLIFLGGSLAYFLWIQLFLKILRKNNYQNFHLSSKENNATLQLVEGMTEIKLNNGEHLKRWEWEAIQSRIFKLSFKTLSVSQLQLGGTTLINQVKDVIITYIVANLVIQGELSLGAMLAVQYIIGQLNSPIYQIISFVQQGQEAKISMERLNEVHLMKDEEDPALAPITQLPAQKTIVVENLIFTYPGSHEPVLNGINLTIEEGKVTAIVGSSGSGKTTLLKLLLKFYSQYEGKISIGGTDLKEISPSFWRKNCGTVMQDGFIFNDTIARNIAVGDQFPNQEQLDRACSIANIFTFIHELPSGFNSLLGSGGQGISQGQKQRILIARAVYKNPNYLLFDEATNALDSNNEKSITEQLNDFFMGRTVIIIAHRLSTVKKADKIVVLESGIITEEGNHASLLEQRGRYYELVKNQLELTD